MIILMEKFLNVKVLISPSGDSRVNSLGFTTSIGDVLALIFSSFVDAGTANPKS